ncbi:MAG: class I SAM-dependent methyltransferase [Steroidobacteraceae bacterium]
MNHADDDRVFAGSIPQLYEQYMVPLFFEVYADDLAARIARRRPSRILEIAAGTGILTRRLASILAPDVSIVATDLNQPMLDQAAALGAQRPIEWRQADAMQLPYPDESFDVVACQFGVMFFPDKPKAFSEARRVLAPGGAFIFNVWDRLDQNEFAETVTQAVERLFPEDPPRFLARVPHGYHEPAVIVRDLAAGGFARSPGFTTMTARSRADSSHIPAVALCQGTPFRNEILARGPSRLGEVTDVAAAAMANRFGPDAVDGKIQAHIICIEK